MNPLAFHGQAIYGLTSQNASSQKLRPALASRHERHSAPQNAPQDDHPALGTASCRD